MSGNREGECCWAITNPAEPSKNKIGDASHNRFFTAASRGSDEELAGKLWLPAVHPNDARMLLLKRLMLLWFITEGAVVVG